MHGTERAVGSLFVILATGAAKRVRAGEKEGDDVSTPFPKLLLTIPAPCEVVSAVSSALGMKLSSA